MTTLESLADKDTQEKTVKSAQALGPAVEQNVIIKRFKMMTNRSKHKKTLPRNVIESWRDNNISHFS
jgi:hypothetical protein